MADYAITFARSARKELEALDAVLVNRIWARIWADPAQRNQVAEQASAWSKRVLEPNQ